MNEVNPFKNIKEKELSEVDNIESNGSVFLSDLREINVGDGGSNVFRADKKGIYLGGTNFDNAKFSVDMNGNAKLLSATISGFIAVGGAASDVNTGSTTISGGKITANSISADKIVAGSLVVGTNVGLGTAQDSAGVTTIVGNTVTTSFVNALNVTAQYVVASVSLSSPVISGGSIAIGSGNSIFKADSNGIYLGNATFGSAPFRVSMAGALIASSVTLTNAGVGAGSTWTGNQIANAYIGNLSATKITTDTLSADRIAAGSISATKLDVDNLSSITANIGSITSGTITGATVSSSSGNDRIVLSSGDYLDFYASGSLKARLTATTSGSGGLKLTSGDIYLANDKSFWVASSTGGSNEYGGIGVSDENDLIITSGTSNDIFLQTNAGGNIAVLYGSSQAIFYNGINCEGNFNVDSSDSARFEGCPVYFYSSGTDNRIQATSTVMTYEADSDHYFYVGGAVSVDAIIDANIWTNGDLQAEGTKPFLIQHPDGTKDKMLRYTSQESPDVVLRYRGKAKTDKKGKVTITPPKHFILMSDPNGEITVNLTPIGNYNIFLEEDTNSPIIKVGSSEPEVSFHYEIMIVRDGYSDYKVELTKGDKNLTEKDNKLMDKIEKRKNINKESKQNDKKSKK